MSKAGISASEKLGVSVSIPVATSATKLVPANNKRPTIIIYPTVSPESIIIPILSSIMGFPLLALMVICCLRRRAKLARERARRRNCGMTNAGLSLARLGAGRSLRTPSVVSRVGQERQSLDLATVLEERSDPDITQSEIILTPEKEEKTQISKMLTMSQPARYFLEGGR